MAEVLRLTPDDRGEMDRPSRSQSTISTDLDLYQESVGQDLCRVRQRSGKMLMDIWRELKIPPHHLIAIEKSCFEALPGRVYAIGFVRSYAAYLGLDPEICVARLKAEMAGPDLKLPVVRPSAPLERKDQGKAAPDVSDIATGPEVALFSRLERLPRHVVAGLITAVLIFSGYHFVASAWRVTPPSVFPVPARLSAEAGLAPIHAGVPPIARVGQPARIADQPAPAPSTEVTPTQPVSVAIEPAPGFHAPLPLGQRYGMQNRNSRVILRVHRPSRVAIEGTRKRIFINRLLDAGDTYRVPNVAGVKLSVPDAGAIEVILDGNTVGFAGRDGIAARGLSLEPRKIIGHYRWQQS
jgi:cytoskeleton protein RodZ